MRVPVWSGRRVATAEPESPTAPGSLSIPTRRAGDGGSVGAAAAAAAARGAAQAAARRLVRSAGGAVGQDRGRGPDGVPGGAGGRGGRHGPWEGPGAGRRVDFGARGGCAAARPAARAQRRVTAGAGAK